MRFFSTTCPRSALSVLLILSVFFTLTSTVLAKKKANLFPQERPPDIVIDDMVTGPVKVRRGKTLLVTPAGIVTLTNGTYPDAAIRGRGNNITIINNGAVKTLNGDNAAAIRIIGKNATVRATGTFKMTGNNSPGIEIQRGFGAIVESSGTFISGETQADNNNEGISVVGGGVVVNSSGRFTSIGQNSEWISLVGGGDGFERHRHLLFEWK